MSNRKIANIFINPKVQIPMIAYVSLLGLFVCALNYYVGYLIMDNISSILMGEEESIKTQISHFVFLAVSAALLLNLFFVFISAVFVLSWGHRFLGAQYALVRVIREQLMNRQYEQNIKLRDEDYLQDLAKALDDFRDQLNTSNK